MATHTTPPRQFFFRCPECNEYPVTEKTLREFITPLLHTKLNEELGRGALGAMLIFDKACPRCKGDGDYDVNLAALWPRKN